MHTADSAKPALAVAPKFRSVHFHPMKIAVKQFELFIENATCIGTPSRLAQVVAELVVEVDGKRATGTAVQCLAPGFFTGADRAYRDDVADMLHVIETACDFAVQVTAGKMAAESVFDLWQRVYMEQAKWANGEGYGPGLWMMGLSVMERAVIDAVCRSKGAALAAAVRANLLGMRLGEMHAELQEFQPALLLPAEPVIAVAQEMSLQLLGSERFASITALRDNWEKLRSTPELAAWLSRVSWISQPVNRDTAMSAENEDALLEWEDRPAIVLDESNTGITSAADALDSGYAGVVHRDCRGVMKGIADACLMEHRRRTEPGERAILGVGDSLVVGVAGRERDLASAASLGISPLIPWATKKDALDTTSRTPVDQWKFESLGLV